ncbi:MAG: hypothetical protein PVJ72_13510 [Gammaproteobacteria bacterium]|jgi:hypothetical protein
MVHKSNDGNGKKEAKWWQKYKGKNRRWKLLNLRCKSNYIRLEYIIWALHQKDRQSKENEMNPLNIKIQKELIRLGKKHWVTIIETLQQRFEQYPFDDDSHTPGAIIYGILQGLDEKDDMVDDRFIHRLHQINCFTHRAFRDQDGEKIYWNPLEQSYIEFCHNAGDIVKYQASQEYPASDIIKTWLYQQMKQLNRKESNGSLQ